MKINHLARSVFILILLAIVPGLVGFAQVENQPVIDSLLVNIWPEYDQPEVLVIYRIVLDTNTVIPAQVALRIPRSAGRPYKVAYYLEDEMPYLLDYQYRPEGDWAWITLTTPSNLLQVEYYDPVINQDQPKREITYIWPGDMEVRSLSFSVQAPIHSSRVAIQPPLGNSLLGEDGLTYYERQVGSIKAGSEYRMTIQYEKPDQELSFQSQPVEPAAPLENIPGQFDIRSFLPWAFGILGLIALVLGVGWWVWWRNARAEQKEIYRRHKPSRKSENKEIVYCHECGKRAEVGDHFCRVCGALLRRVDK